MLPEGQLQAGPVQLSRAWVRLCRSASQREALTRRVVFMGRLLREVAAGSVGRTGTQVSTTGELVSLPALEEGVRQFTEVLAAGGIDARMGVVAVFLAFLARYPRRVEIERSLVLVELNGWPHLIDFLCKAPDAVDAVSRSTTYGLVRPPAGTLLVDVTDTLDYPGVTGIQRVTRNLCRELVRKRRAVARLMAQSDLDLRPRLLELEEERHVTAWQSAGARRKRDDPGSSRASVSKFKFARALLKSGYVALATFLQEVGKTWPWGQRLLRRLERLKKRFKREHGRRPAREHVSVVVPVGCRVLLPEVAGESERVALYAVWSQVLGVSAGLVLHDLITITHPEYFVPDVQAKTLAYTQLLRWADRVACVSRHVEGVARLFVRLSDVHFGSLAKVREIRAIPLAAASPVEATQAVSSCAAEREEPPLVLCVGTFEPRKNGLNVLRAALRVWRQGHRFRLRFVGHTGWKGEVFWESLTQLREAGFDVDAHVRVSDAELWALYREATCTVFCSFVEGFGLPVVESLAAGTPCVTSSRGSMKEIAEAGGCLLVDPENPDEIAEAVRRLLENEDGVLERLREEAARYPHRTWEEYADEVYRFLYPAEEGGGEGVEVTIASARESERLEAG